VKHAVPPGSELQTEATAEATTTKAATTAAAATESAAAAAATAKSTTTTATAVTKATAATLVDVLVILGCGFQWRLPGAVRRGNKGPVIRIAIAKIGQDLGDERPPMGIEFRIGIVPGPFHNDRERCAPHPGRISRILSLPSDVSSAESRTKSFW
jgi:hypothetical protein